MQQDSSRKILEQTKDGREGGAGVKGTSGTSMKSLKCFSAKNSCDWQSELQFYCTFGTTTVLQSL